MTVVWIIAFHCLLTVTAWADFRIVERDKVTGMLRVRISGTITERDAKAFQELSSELERVGLGTVYLDSTGGDVVAAMQIGRLIRKYDGWTEIENYHSSAKFDAKCYSSCALIFIAGVLRLMDPFASLGLHRPYLASAPQGRQAIEKQFPQMLAQVKQYVAEMGVTDNFYQQMVNTEPSRMVLYFGSEMTESEAATLGFPARARVSYRQLIPERDAVHQEIEISYDARRYGVTTSEMRRREIDAEQECDKRKGSDWYYCREALRWGLSQRVYREREEKARGCSLDDEDKKLLQAMPMKERRDHPLLIKRETCIRNIMLGGT
jgi:hypothetical protein